MKQHGILWFILWGLLAFILPAYSLTAVRGNGRDNEFSVLLTATPTSSAFPPFERDDLETKAVMGMTQASFERRYRALSTLRLEGFDSLLSVSPEAKAFWEREAKKLSVEIKHAELNQLRYVEYDFSLDYLSVEIDPEAQWATVVLEENGAVVYELSAKLNPKTPLFHLILSAIPFNWQKRMGNGGSSLIPIRTTCGVS